MEEKKKLEFTFAKKKASPLIQVATSLLLGWAGMGLCHLAEAEPGSEYFAGVVGVLFFTIINVVVSIAYSSYLRYTIPSYCLFAMLVAVLLLSAKFLSSISIWSLSEYRMMLVSIGIFYFIASILVRLIRVIYEASEKEF